MVTTSKKQQLVVQTVYRYINMINMYTLKYRGEFRATEHVEKAHVTGQWGSVGGGGHSQISAGIDFVHFEAFVPANDNFSRNC